jgi:hypothetical protein
MSSDFEWAIVGEPVLAAATAARAGGESRSRKAEAA